MCITTWLQFVSQCTFAEVLGLGVVGHLPEIFQGFPGDLLGFAKELAGGGSQQSGLNIGCFTAC